MTEELFCPEHDWRFLGWNAEEQQSGRLCARCGGQEHQVDADLRPPWDLDGMTLLGSRPALDAWVAGHRDRPGTAVSLNPASLRRFNAAFGHLAGDMLLIRLATALQTAAPADAVVYRASGGQFMAVRLGDDDSSARQLADRLQSAALSIPVPAGWSFQITCGVSTGSINQCLVEAAEQAT